MKLQKRYESFKKQLDEASAQPLTPVTRPANPRATSLVMGEELENVRRELETANEALAKSEANQSLQPLDAARVRPSSFRNRDERSFERQEFRDLVDSIRSSGGNSVPVDVRRIKEEGYDFEIVYGHRRHRACLELGLPLLAIVHGEVDDKSLYQAMTRENSQRDDLTPWEWGQHYVRGLELHYQSQKELALDNGRSEAHVSMTLDLVRLPKEIVGAFASPLDLQVRWGGELRKALAKAPEAVLGKAKELARARNDASAADVYRLLKQEAARSRAGAAKSRRKLKERVRIEVNNLTAQVSTDARKTVVEIRRSLSEPQFVRLQETVRAFLQAEFNG